MAARKTTTDEHRSRLERGSAFAVPTYLVEPHREAVQSALGLRHPIRSRIIDVAGYDVDALLFPGRIRGAKTYPLLIGEGKPLAYLAKHGSHQAIVTQRIVIVIVPEDGESAIRTDEPSRIKEKDAHRYAEAAVMAKVVAAECSRLTGRKFQIHLHLVMPTPPYPKEDGIVHLVFGVVPPGQHGKEWRDRIFGRSIREDGRPEIILTPTIGRGIVVRDTEGTAFAQILENTVYLLVPIVEHYRDLASMRMFGEMLIAIANTLRLRDLGKRTALRGTPGLKAFLDCFTERVNEIPMVWEAEAETKTRTIERLQHDLANAYRELAELRGAGELWRSTGFLAAALERLPKDYRRIRRHPLVERMTICEGGWHIETKLISIAWRERIYPIGRFIIRLAGCGEVSIWEIEAKHRNGIPHPHISSFGIPCYGTATQAIAEAAGQYRFGDCVEYLLTWLTEGYAPELAVVKIEEWSYLATEAEMNAEMTEVRLPCLG